MMHDQELIYRMVSETPRTVREITELAYPTKSDYEHNILCARVYKILSALTDANRVNYTKMEGNNGRPTNVYWVGQMEDRCILLPEDERVISLLSNDYRTTNEIASDLHPSLTERDLTLTRARLYKLHRRGLVDRAGTTRVRTWRLMP